MLLRFLDPTHLKPTSTQTRLKLLKLFKTILYKEKRKNAVLLQASSFLPNFPVHLCLGYTLGERGALRNEQTAEHGEERSGADEERGGKKLTTLIRNQKESAAWQSLKFCTCTFIKPPLWCTSLALSVFVSLSFLLPLSVRVPCAVARGVVIFGVFSLRRAHSERVLIAAILEEKESDEEDLFESSRASFSGMAQRGAPDTWFA